MSSSQDKVKIEKINTDEINDVYNLLRISFFIDEPLNKGSSIPKQEEIFALKGIKQGYSLKAVDYQGNIVAVAINLDPTILSKSCAVVNSERLKKVFELMNYVDQHVQNIPDLLDLHMLAVSPEWRNKGLASLLCDHSEKVAHEHGFKGVNMLCTGKYSSKMAESKGYKCRFSLFYDNYTDKNGKPIFDIKLPHTKLGVYTKLFETNKQ